jgi:uncharacterized protein (DUF427 family)
MSMKAIWNGIVVAESEKTIVVEGNHYFPPVSAEKKYFSDSLTTSMCGWKGTANYHTLLVDGEENIDAVWVYRDPKSAAAEIKGYFAFWKGVEIVEK